jgi:hypothetical protein
LIAIAARPLFVSAPAGAADIGQGCGSDPQHPCYVEGWGAGGTIPVANNNLPLRVLVVNSPAQSVPIIVNNSPVPFRPPSR